jgi:hypothetical protein
MPDDLSDTDIASLRFAASSEIDYLRNLGTNTDLLLATGNLGAYEALLYILSCEENGSPVYEVLSNVKSRYSSQSGILNRLRAMRQLGMLEERTGRKKSQVVLAPSEKLIRELGPILLKKYNRGDF